MKKNTVLSVIFWGIVLVPTVLTAIAAYFKAFWLVGIAVVGIFLVLCLPRFRRRANLWMFIISFFTFMPINILLSIEIINLIFDYSSTFANLIRGFVFYMIFTSIEELVLAVVTRLIFRKQYELFLG